MAWWQWDATAPRQGGEEADRRCVLKTEVAESYGIFHIIFSVKYKKVDVRRRVGVAGVTRDSLESQSPMLVLPWLCESENPSVLTK